MSEIGRNDKCPCGSLLKYKKCCLIKQEEQNAWANKLANDDFEKWFANDEAMGKKLMAEAVHNPCPECNQTECACNEV